MSAAEAQKLLAHAESLMEQCEFETAHKFLLRALRIEPENPVILEALGEVVMELGDVANAIVYFKRSVEISPLEGSFARYMYLGQTAEGEEAFQYFGAGVEVMSAALAAAIAARASADEIGEIRLALARAYTAMAELYMTDACDAPNAESECERLLGLAMEADPDGFEPLQALASFRISQCRNDDALAALQQSFTIWGALAPDSPRWPSSDFRVAGARLLIELQQLALAVEQLEALIADDDSLVEPWYLLALCTAEMGDVPAAAEAFQRARFVLQASGVEDPHLEDDINQRLATIAEALAATGESLDDYAPLPEDIVEDIDFGGGAEGGGDDECCCCDDDDDDEHAQ